MSHTPILLVLRDREAAHVNRNHWGHDDRKLSVRAARLAAEAEFPDKTIVVFLPEGGNAICRSLSSNGSCEPQGRAAEMIGQAPLASAARYLDRDQDSGVFHRRT